MDIEEFNRKKTCKMIFSNEIWRSASAFDVGLLHKWELERKIYAVMHNGIKYYANYQFDCDGVPLDGIKEILQHFEKCDPWEIAAWFHFPNGWIVDGVTALPPKNALSRLPDVISAVKNRTGTYVA